MGLGDVTRPPATLELEDETSSLTLTKCFCAQFYFLKQKLVTFVFTSSSDFRKQAEIGDDVLSAHS
jgi:hypothetical protein